jgi:predicted AAA+ superfamily ATPase
MVINNFAPLSQRNDIGALWENFIISERKKQLAYNGFYGNVYYWRNVRQAEIDYLEEQDGRLSAYEIKWNPNTKVKFPVAFLTAYEPHYTGLVHRENFWEWLGT